MVKGPLVGGLIFFLLVIGCAQSPAEPSTPTPVSETAETPSQTEVTDPSQVPPPIPSAPAPSPTSLPTVPVPSTQAPTPQTSLPAPKCFWETATFRIDYSSPELYLASGNQSTLNKKYSDEISTQIKIESNNIKGVAEIFRWKQDYFRTYSAGGKLVGKITVNQIMEEKALSGCHDHGLVLVSVFRNYGFPAIMVDTAGIQWAWDYSTEEQEGFAGHVFVEVYVNNNWILINSTSGEYVENYNPSNSVIPITSPDEDKGYFVLFKGLDPEEYGITSIQQLTEHLKAFAQGVKSVDMHFPEYEITRFP